MSHTEFEHRGDALGRFIEECGEALAAAGKTVRFGWDGTNPLIPEEERISNEVWLSREIADVKKAIRRLSVERGWIEEFEYIAEERTFSNDQPTEIA